MRICIDSNQFIFGISGTDPASYLVSDNRHFLSDLTGAAFDVLRPEEFIHRYYRAIVLAEGEGGMGSFV